jgi:hypothetical protein
MIGGEMYAWSDQGADQSSGGTTLHLPVEHLATPGARVLVAGPHDPALIRRLLDLDAQVSWLVRSHVDAGGVLSRFGDIRVLCGSLSKMPTEARYDMVVALDGLGRLCSTEGVVLDWAQSLEVLLRVLATDGRLLLSVDNPIGIHRLIQPDAWHADRGDSAWLLAEQVDPSTPTNLADLLSRLRSAGLASTEALGAFAEPRRPAALVDVELLDDTVPTERRDALANVIATVSRQGWRDQPLLMEPQWLTSNAIRNGLGAGVAAAWVVVARREGTTPENEPADKLAAAPRVIITDQPGVEAWSVTYALEPAGAKSWTRRALLPAPVREDRFVRRDPAKLNGHLPEGDVLENVLIAISLRHDRIALKSTLMSYAAWLRRLVEAGDARVQFASPRNVAYSDDTFDIRDTSWELATPWPFEIVFTRALREFAVELLTGGYNHPWPSTVDADRLTIILGAIAGFEIKTQMVDRAVASEVDLRTVIGELDDAGRRDFAHRLGEAGSTSGAIDMLSFQRLRQAHARQADEIASLQDKLKWLDNLLVSRERALRKTLQQVNALTGSITYRVGRVVIGPALATRKQWQRTMNRLRADVAVADIDLDSAAPLSNATDQKSTDTTARSR